MSRVDGLPYREVSGDGEASTVDVYMPDGAGGRPAVVLLHGLDLWSEGEADIPLGGFFATEIARLGATVFDFRWDTSGGWSSRSAADLSCIGSFVAARASEYGADADRIVIVGHSMGAPAGANLAFRSFEIVADADCLETVSNPRAAAVVGIGGAYGVLARPVASAPGRFLASSGLCNTPEPVLREVAASDELAPGLTAQQGYELDGYSSMQLAPSDLQVVLVVGSLDPWHCTTPEVTKGFADALRAEGVDAQVVVLEGRGHEDVVQPYTLAGSLTLQLIGSLLADL